MENYNYVLITAAKNEEGYIEKPLGAVTSQSIKPKKWIIVDDGSVDGTAEIVKRFQVKHRFIELVEAAEDTSRNFGSKARAVNYAYERLKSNGTDYAFVGNLDADVSLDAHYYESILAKFKANQKLGVAGGVRYDWMAGKFVKVICARNSVGGPFQLFRRECFEAIGGYLPLRYGGIDAVAETSARMHGWAVESFPDLRIKHYRTTGTAKSNLPGVAFKAGIRDYVIGYHPLFLILRAASRMHQRPYVVGSLFWIGGYFWAGINRYERPVTRNFVRYIRSEQLARLRSPLSGAGATLFP